MKLSDPALLAHNVNTWLHSAGNEKRMIRTVDGRARGFLSPKYRPLDNYDLGQAVLPALIKAGAQVVSSELTETRMYIKAILPSLSDIIPQGLQLGAGHQALDRGTVIAATLGPTMISQSATICAEAGLRFRKVWRVIVGTTLPTARGP